MVQVSESDLSDHVNSSESSTSNIIALSTYMNVYYIKRSKDTFIDDVYPRTVN